MSSKVSIIIPVYNVEAYVGRTLESVFDTTASADMFEVIVVNDGTKDKSMDIVRQFTSHPNLIIVEQDNQGLSAARMKGLSVAKGDYAWFIDSDDYLVGNGVSKVLELLSEKLDADVLMFPLRWINESERKERLDYQVREDRESEGKAIVRDSGLPLWAAQRFVFRRSLLENEALFFPKNLLHEDEYFGPVLMYLAKTVYVLKYPVYLYRIRPGSIMSSGASRSWYDMVSIHSFLIRFMEEEVSREDKDWFRSYCFNRLESVYRMNTRLIGTPAFDRFTRAKGFYVWRKWLEINPEKSFRNKLGRLLYYISPGMKKRLFRKN